MLNSVGNSLINEQILGQNNVVSIDSVKAGNAYKTEKSVSLDSLDISDEALSLYQREKDVSKFSSMVMDSMDDSEGIDEIAQMINSGKYQISDEDLAGSLFSNEDFTNVVF